MARYGIIIDANRCTGCMTCVLACKEENFTRPGVWWNKVLELDSEPLNRIVYFRYACMHCDDPPCVEACPENAVYKRPDGIVLIDQYKCKGRGKCVESCPYGVIDVNPKETYFPGQTLPYESTSWAFRMHAPGRASKCTLCVHRIEEGREPACVAGCPSRAMVFVDLDDPDSAISSQLQRSEPLLPSKGTNPKVFYILPRNTSKQVERKVTENPRMNLV